jgi:hypothetical protein
VVEKSREIVEVVIEHNARKREKRRRIGKNARGAGKKKVNSPLCKKNCIA